MEEDSNPMHISRCFSCLASDDEKRLHTYIVQSASLKSILQMNRMILCFICKRVAQQAEHFMYNVQTNQILMQNYGDPQGLSCEALRYQRSSASQLINLTALLPSPDDVISLTGHVGVGKPKIGFDGEYVSASAKKEYKVKKELQEEASQCEAQVVDESDELEGYEEVISSEVDSDDEPNEYVAKVFKQSMKRERQKVQKRNMKGIEIKIKAITIPKAKLIQERLELAKDPRYAEAMYKCTDCIKWFVVKSSLDKHMELHNPANGKFECDICKQRMSSEERLNAHYSRHIKRYKCGVCGHTRRCQPVVKAHFLMKHCGGRKEFYCHFCGKAYGNKTSLYRHRQIKHLRTERVKCEYCDRKYVDKSTLWHHLITNHAAAVSADVKQHSCGQCGRVFVSRGTLRAHSCGDVTDKKYYCVECDKSFGSKFKLQNHLKRTGIHMRYENMRYECPYCVRRFVNRRDVDRHVNGIHLHVKSFKCDTCQKRFADKRRLEMHTRKIHEGYIPPKNFSCTICNKMFQEKKSLTAHLRTHTGEKPFQCSQCAAQFTHSGTLHNHVKLVHLNIARNRKKQAARPAHAPLGL